MVADSRSPRDGRYIEKLGTYNPVTNPASIDINIDSSVDWLMKGAQPTDTARAILSYKGVLYKKHLQIGVNKGALTQEQADEKYAEWLTGKENKIQSKRDRIASDKENKKSEALKAEKAKKDAISAKILSKTSELSAEVEAVAETETVENETEVADVQETQTDATAETAVIEEVANNESPAETVEAEPEAEAIVEAVAEDAVAEEVTTETVAESSEEVGEASAEEAPAADSEEEQA